MELITRGYHRKRWGLQGFWLSNMEGMFLYIRWTGKKHNAFFLSCHRLVYFPLNIRLHIPWYPHYLHCVFYPMTFPFKNLFTVIVWPEAYPHQKRWPNPSHWRFPAGNSVIWFDGFEFLISGWFPPPTHIFFQVGNLECVGQTSSSSHPGRTAKGHLFVDPYKVS